MWEVRGHFFHGLTYVCMGRLFINPDKPFPPLVLVYNSDFWTPCGPRRELQPMFVLIPLFVSSCRLRFELFLRKSLKKSAAIVRLLERRGKNGECKGPVFSKAAGTRNVRISTSQHPCPSTESRRLSATVLVRLPKETANGVDCT